MLIKDLYHILSSRHEEGYTIVEIALNPNCVVYKGHFPGQPILPGVCAIQMIHECAPHPQGIASVERCRFTHLLTPAETPKIEIRYASTLPNRIEAEIWANGIRCVSCRMTLS
jgi:3-hydroxyacyl-[acyl-carrier-protein] dehydratase